MYKFTQQGTEYVISAGDAAGITVGSEFAVYAEYPFGQMAPLGFLITSKVKTSTSTLVSKPSFPAFTMPPSGYGHQIRSGPRNAVVNVAFQPLFFDAINPMNILASNLPPGVRIVDDRKYADLVLNKNDEGIAFEILDKSCTNYGLFSTSRSKYETLEDILFLLQATSHYYFHLHRSSRSQFLASRLDVECFEVYTPFPKSDGNLNSNGLITVIAGGSDDEGKTPAYGFQITNNSRFPLFIAVYFFNASDLSISWVMFIFHLYNRR